MKYITKEDLENFGIHYSEDAQAYTMNNIPKWNIQSDQGQLSGNYWYFKNKLRFTMEPTSSYFLTNGHYKRNLFKIWNKVGP